MRYARWIKLCAFSVIFIFLIIGAFNYVIDPYQNNNTFHFRLNSKKISVNKSAIYKKLEQLEKKKFILVFGTSRSLRITPEILGFDIINPNFVYGNPFCVMKFLKSLNENQIRNIEAIYYNLSGHVFKDKQCKLDLEPDVYHFIDYFMLSTLKQSVLTIYYNITNKSVNIVSDFGYIKDPENKNTYRPCRLSKRALIAKMKYISEDNNVVKAPFVELGKINDFVLQHDIDIVYFTDILTDEYFALIDFENLTKFHVYLVEYIDKYYAFNFIDGFSNQYKYFSDISHVNSDGMKFVFDHYFTDKYLIDKRNIDDYIKYLEKYHKKKRELLIYNAQKGNKQ